MSESWHKFWLTITVNISKFFSSKESFWIPAPKIFVHIRIVLSFFRMPSALQPPGPITLQGNPSIIQGWYLCLLSLLLSKGANNTKNQIRLNQNHSLTETSGICWGNNGKNGAIDHNTHMGVTFPAAIHHCGISSDLPGPIPAWRADPTEGPSADPWKNRSYHFINILKPHIMQWQRITVGKIIFKNHCQKSSFLSLHHSIILW